jgi:hypothetical protein
MMNSRSLFERELKQLADCNLNSNSLNAKQIDTKLAYFKTQEFYLSNELPLCFKNLILNYINSLSGSPCRKQCPYFEQLENLVANEFKLNLITINNSLANSLRNDFFLNLLTLTQNILDWLEKHLNQNPSNNQNSSALSLDSLSTAHINTCFLLNNLSIVNFSLKKYALSCLFFKKSLNENLKFANRYAERSNDHNNNSDESKLNKQITLSNSLNRRLVNRHYEILYNMGVGLLFNKQPIEAFECFLKVVDCYTQNARVWLRLAECCVVCSRHRLSYESFKSANQFIKLNSTSSANEKLFKLSEKIKCISRSFGLGGHHKIQIAHSLSRDPDQEERLGVSDFAAAAGGKAHSDELMARLVSLDFAYMCLKNALNLLPTSQSIFSSGGSKAKSTSGSDQLRSGSKITAQMSSLIDSMDDLIDTTTTSSEAGVVDLAGEGDTAAAAGGEAAAGETSLGGSSLSPNSLKQASLRKQQIQLQQKLFNCVWPSKPLNLAQLQNLRSSILVSLAYVSLCLKDYHSSVKYANLILDTQDPLNAKCPPSNGNKYYCIFELFRVNWANAIKVNYRGFPASLSPFFVIFFKLNY